MTSKTVERYGLRRIIAATFWKTMRACGSLDAMIPYSPFGTGSIIITVMTMADAVSDFPV